MLKERILSMTSGLTCQAQGKVIIFIFEANIGGAIKNACVKDWYSNAIHLAHAADIVRKDIFEHRYNFSCSFDPKCEENAVPQSPISLVSMIFPFSNIENQISQNQSKVRAALSISELLLFNSVNRSRASEPSSVRHITIHDAPLPIHITMKSHALTRQK